MAIIAEPTRCEAVLAHRGISSVLLKFKGEAGHASGANALQANALHQAMRWGANALALVDGEAHARFALFYGLRRAAAAFRGAPATIWRKSGF